MSGKGWIVITGASSGIGEACAVGLANEGYRVFAGVRKEADGQTVVLKGGENVTPLMIDVTDAESIASAAARVTETVGEEGLSCLMNNAGVSINGPIEYVALDDLRRQLEVNVVGLVAVTQAFMPLIKKAMGRIVNVSSVGGFFTTPILGPYCASKYAVEAISDAMRRELRPWGVQVVTIQPAAIRTAIWEKGTNDAERMIANAPPGMLDDYGRVLKRITKFAESSEKTAAPPEDVYRAVSRALSAARPKHRYGMGTGYGQRKFLSLIPVRMADNMICKALGIGASARVTVTTNTTMTTTSTETTTTTISTKSTKSTKRQTRKGRGETD